MILFAPSLFLFYSVDSSFYPTNAEPIKKVAASATMA